MRVRIKFHSQQSVTARTALLGMLVMVLAGCGGPGADLEDMEADMRLAESHLEALDFDRAERIYSGYYGILDTAHPNWLPIAYGYAVSSWSKAPATATSVDRAKELFGRIVETAPSSGFAMAAAIALARIDMLQDYAGDTLDAPSARRYLKPVMEQAGHPVLRHEAALRYAEALLMELEDPDHAVNGVAFLEDWLSSYPDNPYASIMWELLYDALLHDLDRPDDALAALDKAVESGLVNTATVGIVYYRIASLALDTGNYPLAVEYFRRTLTEWPSKGRIWEAEQALKHIRDTVPGYAGMEIPPSNRLGRIMPE